MKDLVVMSGGGFCQIETGLGTLKALLEAGLRVNSTDAVDYKATSAGGICSSLMVSGMYPQTAIDMIKKHPTDKLISRRWFWPFRLLMGQSVYERKGLEALLRKYLVTGPMDTVEISLTRCADMKNMRVSATYDSVLASSSIEGIFEPVQVAGVRCIDGGYTDNVPFESSMLNRYRYVFIVLYPDDPDKDRHKKSMIGRLLEGFSSKISQEVNEAERVYSDEVVYPQIVVLRPPPAETSLLDWSEKYWLVDHAYESATKRLRRRFPNGIH